MMKTAVSPVAGAAPARKLFYRIQEVAKMTGLKPYVLRYWETEFPELSPAKDGSDQRRYRQSDIEVVVAIRKLLYEDRFTIEGARKRLREELRRMRGEPEARPAPAPVKVATIKSARPAAKGAAEKLDRSLARLRREVNDLLELLSA